MDGNELCDTELTALLSQLFPHGFAGRDLLKALAPQGWVDCPLMACFHPDVRQVWREAVRIHRNLEGLTRKRGASKPAPTFEEISLEFKEKPVDPERELRELVAMCLWDVFSDNHDVIAPDGRLASLGSFRGSAGFIADHLNAEQKDWAYDYMDFYMGSIWIRERADLGMVYQLIFRRLSEAGCDWHYSFPRLGLVDMRPLKEELERNSDSPEWAEYSPSGSFDQSRRDEEQDAKLAEFQKDLDSAYQEEVEAALRRPLPTIIASYRAIYGKLPQGWPPERS